MIGSGRPTGMASSAWKSSCGKLGAVVFLAIVSCTWIVQAADEKPARKNGSGEQIMAEDRMVTPNAFGGTDVERINQAIDAAAAIGAQVLIPRLNHSGSEVRDVWLLDSAILVKSNTTLILENCHLKLSDRCRDNIIRSANCGLGIRKIEPMENIHIRGVGRVVLGGADHPRATGDSGKTLGKHTYGTDAGMEGESQTGDWRNLGILFAYVDHFSIENLAIHDSHSWAISLERCAHGHLQDLRFASTEYRTIDGARERILNQDGIDLRLGCHDILIENISGHTGDDLIALTAIPREDQTAGGTTATMVSEGANRGDGKDNIRHVILRNIKGYSRGGHHIVRLLNTPGVKLHDIVLDGLIDTSPEKVRCKAAVKIGDHNYGGGVAPLGDTSRIIINNVISKAQHTILIGGSLADSSISNVIRRRVDGSPITYVQGEEMSRNVVLSNVMSVPE